MTLAELINLGALTYVKHNTQKANSLIHAYRNGDRATSLYDVYGRFSYAKDRALDYCCNLKEKIDGYFGYICSHNTCMFTYGFLVLTDDKKLYLVYITKSYNYITEYPYLN